MYGNDYTVAGCTAVRTHFPLREVCGRWVSLGGSPDVRIYFTGKRYRLEFFYDPATAFRRPVFRRWGTAFFYLYGRIGLSYDAGRDVLALSEYGEYVRAED